MKNVWKRMMCLLLSGVLLLSNVPFPALAEEAAAEAQAVAAPAAETEPVQTEPQVPETEPPAPETEPPAPETQPPVQETEPPVPETQPTQSAPEELTIAGPVTDQVANAGADETESKPKTYPIKIGKEEISDANKGDVLGDQTIAFDPEKNMLILNGASADSITSTDASKVLTIQLAANSVNEIKGELKAENGIEIVGEGKLTVYQITAEGNLTISAVVMAGKAKESGEEEQKCIISVNNTIELKDTVASNPHLLVNAAGHKAIHFSASGEEQEKAVKGSGYYRWDKEADFEEVTEKITSIGDDGYFEFISKNHLTGEDTHIRTCDCSQNTKVAITDHTPTYNVTEGSSELTSVCNAEGCGRELGKLTITAEDAVFWDGKEKKATIESTLPSDIAVPSTVTYYKIENGSRLALSGAPVETGDYAAVVVITLNEKSYSLCTEYAIRPVQLEDSMVTLSSESEQFVGPNTDVTHPTISVKLKDNTELTLDTHYTVSYYRGSSKTTDFASIGDITVKVTGIKGCSGAIEKCFKITKIAPTAGLFDFVPPETLVYDGTLKTATVTTKAGIAGMGQVTVKYFKNETPLDSQPIDAGVYNVKISVAEGENYAATTTDLMDAQWSFTIAPCTELTDDLVSAEMTAQTLCQGTGAFVEPTFTGKTRVGATVADKLDADDGTMTYWLDDTQYILSELKNQLANKPDGSVATIKYQFVPGEGENYSCTKEGTIEITVAEVTFHMEGKENFTADDLKKANPIFGDVNIIDTSKLSAKFGDQEVADEVFSVEYFKPGTTQQSTPDVGLNNFVVMCRGTLNGTPFTKKVCDGQVNVVAKAISIVQPTGKHLIEEKNADNTLKDQALIDAIQVSDPASGAKVEYYVNNSGETWSEDIPERSTASRYEVKYRITAENYETKEGSVWTTIQPKLTAVYGQTLLDVVGVPTDGKWAWAQNDAPLTQNQLSEHNVGHAGISESFQMTYNNSAPFAVKINVSPKSVTPVIEAKDQVHYLDRKKIAVKVYDPYDPDDESDDKEIEEDEKEYKYEVVPIATKTGWTSIKVTDNKDNGNYQIEETTKPLLLYYPTDIAFTSLQDANDEPLYDTTTVPKVKASLSDKIEDTDHPESAMVYRKVMMISWGTQQGKEQWLAKRDLSYYPEGGFTHEIAYEDIGAGFDSSDDYKVSIMEAATSADLGTTAGKVTEITDFEKTETGIQFKAAGYSIICVAPKVDVTKPYNIKTSVIYNSKTSTKGSLSVKVDSKTATTAMLDQTVKVTASADTGYSIQSVTVTKSNGDKVTTTQSGSTYTFKMPADNVTVKLSLKKTSSSTKNPYSGDTSNIYLWMAILAASVVGIVALVIVWFKKRK